MNLCDFTHLGKKEHEFFPNNTTQYIENIFFYGWITHHQLTPNSLKTDPKAFSWLVFAHF